METIRELIAAGRLGEATSSLIEAVRARPLDPANRLGLVALLVLQGELDRAGKQLDALDRLPAGQTADLARLRMLLGFEADRASNLAGESPPPCVGESSATVAGAFEAWRLAREGRCEEAAALAAGLEEARSARVGRLGGEPIGDLVDAHDLLRPCLEVFTPEGYAWVAWEDVQYLAVRPPADLLDVAWTPARLATHGGTIGVVMLPGLYPGTAARDDDEVRLGRRAEWRDLGAGLVAGYGPKVFCVDGRALTLRDLADLELDRPRDGRAAAEEVP